MEENAKQAEVFLELRKRLQSGLLVLRRDVVKSYSDVSVTGGDSSLHIRTPQGLQCVVLPAGVSLVEGSCREAPGAGDEMHFRMRLSVDHQHPDKKEAPGSVMERLLLHKSYCFHCQSCETRVLEERVFKRVLPLPNGNWNSLVDDWCCHPDPFANLKLLPRVDDCLMGDTYLLVPRDPGCDETLTQESSPNKISDDQSQDTQKPGRRRKLVYCKSCSVGLGEAIAPDTLKLFITEVTVRPSVGDHQFDTSLDRSLFVEQTIAARLLELSSSQSIFRFSLQTPEGKAFILLWLLNSDSLIASLSATPLTAVSDDPVICPSQPKCRGHPSATKAGSAVRVLYLPCLPSASTHQEVVDTWEKDISVHPLELPRTTCQEVLLLLTASTSCLPPSLRSMDSYKVAYMRL